MQTILEEDIETAEEILERHLELTNPAEAKKAA
jgi:hypothetical protein